MWNLIDLVKKSISATTTTNQPVFLQTTPR